MFCFSPAKKQANLCNLKILFFITNNKFSKESQIHVCNFCETTSVGEKNKRRKRLAKTKKRSLIFFCWHAAWVCPCTAGHQGQGMQMRLCGRLSCKTCASWPLAIHPNWFCQDLDKRNGFKILFHCPGLIQSIRYRYGFNFHPNISIYFWWNLFDVSFHQNILWGVEDYRNRP